MRTGISLYVSVSDLSLSHAFTRFLACKCTHVHSKKLSPSTIATTQQATKSTMMAMVQREMTTMTTLTDVKVDDDDAASSEAAARREAEAV